MAIRIVNEVPDPSVVKNVICRKCGVKLEYTPNDVHEQSYTDYSGSRETQRSIHCPKCHHTIVIGY